MTAIHVHQLSRTFRVRTKPVGLRAAFRSLLKPDYTTIDAVREVSFAVEPGEAVAFLGPNGAGKSTTIKMLTGILRPSGGSMRVLGLDPCRERGALAFRIGTVFGQKSQLWYHLPAADSFRLLGAVYEVPPADLARRIGELTERFGLAEFIGIPVRKLSLGQRIRCEVAASLLHRPELLFLDEPTIGLDVVAKREIRALLTEWNRDHKTTLFLTSHDIGDVEKLCRRAILINHGTLVLDESIKALKHRAAAVKHVGVRFADSAAAGQRFACLPDGVQLLKESPDAAKFAVDSDGEAMPRLVSLLAASGGLADLSVEDEPLEDLIAALYASTSKEEAHGLVANLRA